MIVVVGGSSRKAGKTKVMCEIISATRDAAWVAFKISPHHHEPGMTGDTERYLAAGAIEARLLSALDVLPEGNVMIESNSVLNNITPDLFVFVEGSEEWKQSAHRHVSRADFVIREHATCDVIERVRGMLIPGQ